MNKPRLFPKIFSKLIYPLSRGYEWNRMGIKMFLNILSVLRCFYVRTGVNTEARTYRRLQPPTVCFNINIILCAHGDPTLQGSQQYLLLAFWISFSWTPRRKSQKIIILFLLNGRYFGHNCRFKFFQNYWKKFASI